MNMLDYYFSMNGCTLDGNSIVFEGEKIATIEKYTIEKGCLKLKIKKHKKEVKFLNIKLEYEKWKEN